MRGIAVPLTIAATLAIAVTLFHLKQRVGDLERELSQVNRTIVAHRETIHVLRTEWSFLNQPARIAELAERHLGMRRNTPDRLIRLDDLPTRDPSPAQAGFVAPIGQGDGNASAGGAPARTLAAAAADRVRDTARDLGNLQ